MSDIVWGEPIEVNGVRPDWLNDECNVWGQSNVHGDWYSFRDWVASDYIWGDVRSIRIPSTHPYYTATYKGFKYWPGGDCAPEDCLDDGDILFRDGEIAGGEGNLRCRWDHRGWGKDIIGYKPKSIYSGGVVTPEDVRASLNPDIPNWALTRADEIMGSNARDNVAKYVMDHEEEPADPLLEIAQNIAADICDIEGCYSDYVKFMREGAYNETHREIKIALAALKRGMEIR